MEVTVTPSACNVGDRYNMHLTYGFSDTTKNAWLILIKNFDPNNDSNYTMRELKNNGRFFYIFKNVINGGGSGVSPIATVSDYNNNLSTRYVTPIIFVADTSVTESEILDMDVSDAYEILDNIPFRFYNGKKLSGIITWLKQWFYDKDEIDTQINDSGWQPLTYVSGYQNYDSTHPLEIRRVGKLVEIRGTFKPTAAKTASTSDVQFATIPSGYRPSTQYRSAMCQGGGVNRFMVTANTNGSLAWQRYGTTSSINLPVTWLGVHITYMID